MNMPIGSSYENYEKTHTDYDQTRLPVGNEQIADFLGKQFGGISPRILDVGCGTGAHLLALYEEGFESLTGIDASVTGLTQASQKLDKNRCSKDSAFHGPSMVCGDMRQMPFAADSFDVVLFSFVLHHLPNGNEAELEDHTKNVIGQAVSLLAPGGYLVIITCSASQLSATDGCMWYYKYFPQAAAKLASRFLPIEKLVGILTASGLVTPVVEAVERTYWTSASLDPRGPADSAWQSGDSLFALCRKDPELFQEQLKQIQGEVASGAVLEHIRAVRSRTETIKQATIVLARKP
jgi:ubiquinone/menaquinone biosynthesis C-methylase UbiE